MCLNTSLGRHTATALLGIREFTLKILVGIVKWRSTQTVTIYICTTDGRAIPYNLADTPCYQYFYFLLV